MLKSHFVIQLVIIITIFAPNIRICGLLHIPIFLGLPYKGSDNLCNNGNNTVIFSNLKRKYTYFHMKNETVINKIKSFMQKNDLKQLDLVRISGLRQNVVSEIMHGKRNIQPLVDAICDHYGINKEWLTDESKPIQSYITGVPYYDVDFLGGFDLLFNDQTTNPEYYIDFKPYEKATCWCNITGHSMEPEISHGDIIALRRVDDWSFLPSGEIYAIVTRNNMRTVKRVCPGSTDDTYKLIPANKSGDYTTQEIDKRDILAVFEVMGCMKKF